LAKEKRMKHRRRRLGPAPLLFFFALAAVAGLAAIAVNIDLEDRIIAYYGGSRK
jgi:hypothetical protein